MTDERLLRNFAAFDDPALPDAAFADGLYERLVGDLGLRRRETETGWRGRLRSWLRPETTGRMPLGRAVELAFVLAVLAGLLWGTVYVANRLWNELSPPDLVRLSQGAYADPPAVRFTVKDAMGQTVVTSDGRGTWKSESWDIAEGSYFLYDGERSAIYDATTRDWRVTDVADGGPPFPFNDAFAWVDISFPDEVATMKPVACDAPVELGETTVAGHVADGIGCPDAGLEYWLDRETHLVLRMTAGEGSRFWRGPAGERTVIEVASFELLDQSQVTAFSWDGPGPTSRPGGPVAGTKLVAGEAAPAWTGRALDGSEVSLPRPGAPMAVLFTSISLSKPHIADLEAATRANPEVAAVVVTLDAQGTLAGYLEERPTTLQVVPDFEQSLFSAWGIPSYPLLLLLDRAGAVADVVTGSLAPVDTERVVAALAAGGPIPPVSRPSEAAAEPTATADPGATECTEARVSCLPDGAKVPAWSGPRPDGTSLSGGELRGLPLVVWFESPGMCEGRCPDWMFEALRGFADLAERYDGRASVLLVASDEWAPGDTVRVLDEAGVDVPVVYDWDDGISRAFEQIVGGVVVLDADGRLAAQAPGPFDAATAEPLLAPLVDPAPSP